MLRLGTAGWSIPSQYRDEFPAGGTHLERYASRFDCVEINSSFYKPHQYKTYERWSGSTPAHFRFSVKVPKTISHAADLDFSPGDLDRFFGEVAGLGEKLGVLLLQLPPGAAFDADRAGKLLDALQGSSSVPVVCEPRHPSWFMPAAGACLEERKIARVAADPARAEGADDPGGWRGLAYFRFHGSPRIYYSDYEQRTLDVIEDRLKPLAASCPTWCIFDNTAAGAALGNVLAIKRSRDDNSTHTNR